MYPQWQILFYWIMLGYDDVLKYYAITILILNIHLSETLVGRWQCFFSFGSNSVFLPWLNYLHYETSYTIVKQTIDENYRALRWRHNSSWGQGHFKYPLSKDRHQGGGEILFLLFDFDFNILVDEISEVVMEYIRILLESDDRSNCAVSLGLYGKLTSFRLCHEMQLGS